MDKLALKAYGKINLGLDVLRRVLTVTIDLKMIMQMVDVYDDIIITKTDRKNEIIVATDKFVLGIEKGNLRSIWQQNYCSMNLIYIRE